MGCSHVFQLDTYLTTAFGSHLLTAAHDVTKMPHQPAPAAGSLAPAVTDTLAFRLYRDPISTSQSTVIILDVYAKFNFVALSESCGRNNGE